MSPKINCNYCRGCNDRKAGCHVKCFAYNVYVARIKIKRDREQEFYQRERELEEYICDKMSKVKRRVHKKTYR